MISRSRNETVPMWAIAAQTLSRVKETNDNDKRAGGEKKNLSQSKNKVRVDCVFLVFSSSVLSSVPVTRVPNGLPKTGSD